jgi:hypothetical protein
MVIKAVFHLSPRPRVAISFPRSPTLEHAISSLDDRGTQCQTLGECRRMSWRTFLRKYGRENFLFNSNRHVRKKLISLLNPEAIWHSVYSTLIISVYKNNHCSRCSSEYRSSSLPCTRSALSLYLSRRRVLLVSALVHLSPSFHGYLAIALLSS